MNDSDRDKDPFTPTANPKPFDRHSERGDEDWLYPLESDFEEPVAEEERPARNFPAVNLLLLIVITTFGLRLLQLQVVSGEEYRNLSTGNSVRAQLIPTDRGLFIDHQGKQLVSNTNKASLSLRIELLPTDYDQRQNIYQQIATTVTFNNDQQAEIESLRRAITGDYLIQTDLNKEQLLLMKEMAATIPAVIIGERSIRLYETLPGLAHLLGYVGQVSTEDLERGYSSLDFIGKTGLERNYEAALRGQFGVQQVEVDSQGKLVHIVASDTNKLPVPGKNIKLGLDAELQKKIAEALQQAIDERNKEFPQSVNLGATVIALDPRSGLIRAMVSLPNYDNNLFARGISNDELNKLYNDPQKPLFNRATAGTYAPGSTIKPLIATGALQFGVVSPNFTVDTPPEIEVGGSTFPDWKDHGQTNIQTAIAESNNIFFYALGGGWQNIKGLGLERLRTTLHWFGLEQATGIDLPSESTGFILSDEWKRRVKEEPIYLGDVYHLSIGQGDIAVTPLQLTTAVAAIANGGTLYEPRLAESLIDAQTQTETKLDGAVKATLPVNQSYLSLVRAGMRQAVVSGSSQPLSELSVDLAGKTGTAQFGNQDQTHAWFVGFGPYDHPEIVVTVLIEGGGGSFEAAIPLAEKVFRFYFSE